MTAVRHELRTERLLLRSITLDAARRLLSGEPPAGEEWAPGYPFADEIGLLRLVVDAGTEPAGWGPWQVIEQVDGVLRAIGGAGFLGPPDERGEVEAGFGLVPQVRGQGLAAEALGGLLGWAGTQGALVVYGTTTPDNLASQHSMLNAGLRRRVVGPGGPTDDDGRPLLAYAVELSPTDGPADQRE